MHTEYSQGIISQWCVHVEEYLKKHAEGKYMKGALIIYLKGGL